MKKEGSNWQDFLRNDENKIEHFQYLAQQATGTIKQKTVIPMLEATVICNQTGEDLTSVSECNHEEVDTQIFIHVRDAAIKGYSKILLRTVDTKVSFSCICHAENSRTYFQAETDRDFLKQILEKPSGCDSEEIVIKALVKLEMIIL